MGSCARERSLEAILERGADHHDQNKIRARHKPWYTGGGRDKKEDALLNHLTRPGDPDGAGIGGCGIDLSRPL